MIKLLLLVLAFCIGQAQALDCKTWKYPRSVNAAENDDAAARYAKGLLWEIRGEMGQISYLFGTIHLSDPRVIAFSKFVEPYLSAVDKFAMEVLITAETPVLLAEKMFYSGDRELGDYLDAGVFNRTLSLLHNHGLDHYSASRLKPWAAYMTLSVPPSDKSVPLDMHLLNLANARGLSLAGVERIEEQLAIFEDLPIPDQVSLLTESICNYAENQAQIDVMLALYLNQDLGGFLSLGEQYRTPINEGLLARLLDGRNQTMTDRITPWLESGSYFIAVGALHLPGAEGILWRLKEKGYQVRAIDAPVR